MIPRRAVPFLFAALVLACSSSSDSNEDSLIITGDAGSPAADPTIRASGSIRRAGDPGSLRIGVYALYISTNPNCSGAIEVQNYGATPSVKDLVNSPTLFSGSPDPGSYQCVGIKMSDVLDVVPDSTFGNCTAGTHYLGDIYRAGESDWKDIDLNQIVGTGTDSAPADDQVLLVLTRDTTAAIARGFSTHQVLELGGDLVSPSHSTFYWRGEGTVVDEGGACGIYPGRPTFQ
jgi:hypothetical protein